MTRTNPVSTVPREVQYLNSHQQVEDLRRLRASWEQSTAQERALQRVPWLLRAGAAGVAVAWLGLAVWLAGPAVAVAGLALFAGSWLAAEAYFLMPRGSATGGPRPARMRWRALPAFFVRPPVVARPPLGWELDRINPHFEGAFSLLELIDTAQPELRKRYLPALEVTLSRVNWNRPAAAPDRRADRRRAIRVVGGLCAAMLVALFSLWLLHRPTLAMTPAEPGPAAKPAVAPPVTVASHTPQITDFRVRIEPPAYMHLPTQENFLTTITAPSGAKVTLSWQVLCDQPVQTWLALGDRQLTQVTRGGAASAVLSRTQPGGGFAVIAQSGTTFTRLPLFLTWRDDSAPRVDVNIAAKSEREREGVRFDLHVEDDYGLTRLECQVSTQPGGPGSTVRVEVFAVALPAGAGDHDRFHGRVLIPSAVLDKLNQDRLRLQVTAYDTRTDDAGRLTPNVGRSDPKDFLVIQPWDNAHKPRSLEHKAGGEADQNNPSDSNNAGGQGNAPQDTQGPRKLQKNPDEPPGPQQQQPGDGGEPSKYSSLAGSQGDSAKPENESKNGSGKPPPQGDPKDPQGPQAPPNTPPAPGPQPSDQPNDPQNDHTHPNSTGGAASTDGAKNLEGPPPPTPPTEHNGSAGDGGGSKGPGSPTEPGAPPTPASSATPPNAGGSPPQPQQPPTAPGPTGAGGGSGAGPKANNRGTSQSNETSAGAKGNAKVDEAVTARGGSVSVEEAMNFARQKPLGAWQRNFGSTAVNDRVVASEGDAGAQPVPAPGAAPESRTVSTPGLTPADRQAHLAAERLRIDQKYSDLIEQYLLRVRSGSAPPPRGP